MNRRSGDHYTSHEEGSYVDERHVSFELSLMFLLVASGGAGLESSGSETSGNVESKVDPTGNW